MMKKKLIITKNKRVWKKMKGEKIKEKLWDEKEIKWCEKEESILITEQEQVFFVWKIK